VNFPILMSNADISRENLLKDVLKKSVIIEQAGEKNWAHWAYPNRYR
jgi:5'-nucleotidase